MSRAESTVFGAASLAAEHLDDLVLGSVRDVHTSISGRVFGALDRVAGRRTPVRGAHDLISGSVYAGLGAGLHVASRALRAADEAGFGPGLDDGPRGRFVISAVNGLIGDSLRDSSPRFSFEMGVRHDGRHVPLEPASIARSYPAASDSLVVFVHGLCETEDYWRRRRRPLRPDEPEPGTYGHRLERDEGWSPVFVRANTGIGIAESGVALSALLGRLVDAWPRRVRRIALVGHSMGGLIIHAAAVVETSSPWRDLVSDVVTLGTPHLGSPVERGIARGLRDSERVPEFAPYTRLFSRRSAGVQELATGMPEVQPLPGVRYRLVAATLSASVRHPVARSIGDLLVQPRSAFARPRGGRPMFPQAETLHVPKADHFDLLNHDLVYDALRRWLRSDADHPHAPSRLVGALRSSVVE